MWLTSADVLVCCLVLHAYVGVIDMTSDGVVLLLLFLEHALKSVALQLSSGELLS